MANKVLMKGNEALAEAAICAVAVDVFFGYPITPQTELAAYMAKKMEKIRRNIFTGGESKVAAINMVYGCSRRRRQGVMTSSSTPGISA